MGLIGQNGAGKTTIFDLICGYQPLDGGRILLGGVDVSSWSPTAAGTIRSRPDLPGWPAVPRPHRRPTRSRCRSIAPSTSGIPFSAAFRLPTHIDSELSVSRAGGGVARPVRHRGVPRHLHRRAVDRNPSDRRARLCRGPSTRACCCSTSPRPGSPNARSRRCRPCCGAFATTWGARSWSSNTTCR